MKNEWFKLLINNKRKVTKMKNKNGKKMNYQFGMKGKLEKAIAAGAAEKYIMGMIILKPNKENLHTLKDVVDSNCYSALESAINEGKFPCGFYKMK